MAKIQTESLVISFSKLVKDLDLNPSSGIITADMLESMNAVAEELAGAGVIVEITTVTE